jgi:alkylated DNA repair dioxygenase AlkB
LRLRLIRKIHSRLDWSPRTSLGDESQLMLRIALVHSSERADLASSKSRTTMRLRATSQVAMPGKRNAVSAACVELRDGGWIRHWDPFLPRSEADRLFETLRREVSWEQFRNHLWTFPRLTAFAADRGVTYRYSGVMHAGSGWSPALAGIRQRIERVAGAAFNGVLLNLYRDGRDSMGRHADAEPELGINPLVASLSLGAGRSFVLRHNCSGEKRVLELTHGSLLLMGGSLQHHWTHELPKTRAPVGERINLTFRHFRTA